MPFVLGLKMLSRWVLRSLWRQGRSLKRCFTSFSMTPVSRWVGRWSGRSFGIVLKPRETFDFICDIVAVGFVVRLRERCFEGVLFEFRSRLDRERLGIMY